MWDDNEVFGIFLGGLVLGLISAMAFFVFTEQPYVSDYPGLSEQLVEQRDDCESRPNVISCEWSEDKVTYVPEDKNLD